MEVLSYVLSDSLYVDFVLQTVKRLLEHHGNELSTDVLLHSDYAEEKTMPKFFGFA